MSQRGETADDWIGHTRFDAFKAQRTRKQHPQTHITELEEIPRAFVGGKRKVRCDKKHPADLEHFRDFNGHQPGHRKVFETRSGIDDVEFLPWRKIGRKAMHIPNDVNVLPGVIIKSHVLRIYESLAHRRGSGDFSATNFQNPQTRFPFHLGKEGAPRLFAVARNFIGEIGTIKTGLKSRQCSSRKSTNSLNQTIHANRVPSV